MYERFYNLRERPFSLTPDPDYLYPSRFHRETLGYLKYGIESHAGFIVITGEIGSGKTTLLQATLRGLDQQTSVARLLNTALDARELIESVMLGFGLEPAPGLSKPYMIRDLANFLVSQRNAGRMALLVIDEAQNLSPAALEEVRMLSNIETEKSKLIQVVLVGQPSLRSLLAAPALEQLRQRVTVSYHLPALDVVETHAYVNHRIRRASLGVPLELSASVTRIVHNYSRGIPRTINVLADAILLFGYADDRQDISADLALEVMEELKDTGLIREPVQPFLDSPVSTATRASDANARYPYPGDGFARGAEAASGVAAVAPAVQARPSGTADSSGSRPQPAPHVPAASAFHGATATPAPRAPAPRSAATAPVGPGNGFTAVTTVQPLQQPRASLADVAAADTRIHPPAPGPRKARRNLPTRSLSVWARLRNSVLGTDGSFGQEE